MDGALDQALAMSDEEARERVSQVSKLVYHDDLERWAKQVVEQFESISSLANRPEAVAC